MNINVENISLFELASQFPDLTISVKCSDLFDAFRSVIHEEELKRENMSQDKNEEVLLTEKEVQEILFTSHSSLYRWNRDKYLCFIKIGNKNRYKYSDVMRIKNNK